MSAITRPLRLSNSKGTYVRSSDEKSINRQSIECDHERGAAAPNGTRHAQTNNYEEEDENIAVDDRKSGAGLREHAERVGRSVAIFSDGDEHCHSRLRHAGLNALLPNVARAMLIVSIYLALLAESDSELVLERPGRARYTAPVPEGLTP